MTAPALPGSAAALLANQIDADRRQAVAVARPRVQARHRGAGVYPVTVGGYVVGHVERHALATSKTAAWWSATDADGRRVASGLDRRADAVEALGATDAAVEAYRAAAREGTFGTAEQRQMERNDAALQAALEADAAHEAELEVALDAEEAEHPPLTGQAAKDDRDEHDALRGVKWVEGCPLPDEMCDPDVAHDHDPVSDATITNGPPAHDEKCVRLGHADVLCGYDNAGLPECRGDATPDDKAYREQAEGIARLATVLAEGTLIGPQHAAVARLRGMVDTLAAWTPDDRSGA